MNRPPLTLKNLAFMLACVWPVGASAMTIEEFDSICTSATIPCQDIPFMQAYIGGALDLLAMLDEETEYLESIYCSPKQELFATTPIINYVLAHKSERPTRNAMMLLIQYLEEEGGCPE